MAYVYMGKEIEDGDVKKILDYVVKGKAITDIEKSFEGKYDYRIISKIVFKEGSQSLLGIKGTITRKWKKLDAAKTKEQRAKVIDEVSELVNTLYGNYKLALDEVREYEKIKSIINKD